MNSLEPRLFIEKKISVDKGDVVQLIKKNSESFDGFGELYISKVNPLMIKAWKIHLRATCNLTVPKGTVKFVIQSKNKKKFWEFIVSDKNYCRLSIPPGYWFGFKNLEKDESLVLNLLSLLHDPDEQESLNEKDINYDWR
tara:strand:+ start:114 stop:533 length:420 start_codon:yes stop_codon:yes gene_type:complete